MTAKFSLSSVIRMRIWQIASLALLLGSPLTADVKVKGYYRKDGTYVAPHYRSSPNSTSADNWSTKGNVNPYTGKEGTNSTNLGGTPNLALLATPPAGSLVDSNSGAVAASSRPTPPASPVVLAALSTEGQPSPPTPPAAALTDAERDKLVSLLLQKVTLLEGRLASLEQGSEERFRKLADSTQKALNEVVAAINQRPTAAVSPKPANGVSTSGLPALEKPGPSVDQWIRIKPLMSMEEVRKILGDPNKIYKDTIGLHWTYTNGNVRFYDSGTVNDTVFR
jgi:hypothetical protein